MTPFGMMWLEPVGVTLSITFIVGCAWLDMSIGAVEPGEERQFRMFWVLPLTVTISVGKYDEPWRDQWIFRAVGAVLTANLLRLAWVWA